MIQSLTLSLTLTLIIELLFSFILGLRNKEDFKIIILANIITKPVVVYITNLTALFTDSKMYILIVLLMEFSACIVEYIIYKKHLNLSKSMAFTLSLINNIASFSTGIIFFK